MPTYATLKELEDAAKAELAYLDFPPRGWVVGHRHASGAPIEEGGVAEAAGRESMPGLDAMPAEYTRTARRRCKPPRYRSEADRLAQSATESTQSGRGALRPW